MIRMKPGYPAIIFDAQIKIASLRIGQTNHGGNQILVGQSLQITFEFNYKTFPFWNGPAHLTNPLLQKES